MLDDMYLSPLLFIKTPNEPFKFVNDFRRLNFYFNKKRTSQVDIWRKRQKLKPKWKYVMDIDMKDVFLGFLLMKRYHSFLALPRDLDGDVCYRPRSAGQPYCAKESQRFWLDYSIHNIVTICLVGAKTPDSLPRRMQSFEDLTNLGSKPIVRKSTDHNMDVIPWT